MPKDADFWQRDSASKALDRASSPPPRSPVMETLTFDDIAIALLLLALASGGPALVLLSLFNAL